LKEGKSETSRSERWREVPWSHAIPGFVLGYLTYFVADEFVGGFVPIRNEVLLPLCGAVAALIALTRARRWLWWLAGLTIALYVVLGWTPLVDGPIRAWVRTDPPRKADAAVVLSSDVRLDGKPYRVSQIRLLAGYEAVGSGLTPILVLTKLRPPHPSMLPYAKQQLETLGTKAQVIETKEAARNTRDEARAVAALAEQRGWKRVIVISDSLHLRRSAALFEREGLEVIARPCLEDDFDLDALEPGEPRLKALRSWTHEVIGMQVYRMRGWLE
jgi:uncharacterized SAM-binding protein YcdF (DUF218 family)